ncbi:MAG: hypothetical protein EOP18_07730, partial [Rhizobiaceae bacterium]
MTSRDVAADSAEHSRLASLASVSRLTLSLVEKLLVIAQLGLPRMYDGAVFAHTLRAISPDGTGTERLEGVSIRYTAMTALGMAHLDSSSQMRILGGGTFNELLQRAAVMAERCS